MTRKQLTQMEEYRLVMDENAALRKEVAKNRKRNVVLNHRNLALRAIILEFDPIFIFDKAVTG